MKIVSPLHNPFRKRQLELKDAVHLLCGIAEIMERLRSQKNYVPDEEDFILLKRLCDEGQDMRLLAMYLHHCFTLRLEGKQEPPFQEPIRP